MPKIKGKAGSVSGGEKPPIGFDHAVVIYPTEQLPHGQTSIVVRIKDLGYAKMTLPRILGKNTLFKNDDLEEKASTLVIGVKQCFEATFNLTPSSERVAAITAMRNCLKQKNVDLEVSEPVRVEEKTD